MKKINKNNLIDVLKEFEGGNQDSALKKMALYIKHNQEDYKNKYNYAVMLEKNKQTDKAIDNYYKVLRFEKNNWRALTNLYLIYFEKEEYAKALELVNKVLIINPDSQSALRDMAHILFYLENLKDAKKYVQKSIKLNPNDYIALNVLGMILDKQGLFEEAKKIYLHAINLNKDYYPSYSNLGKTYLELKEPDKAIEILKTGISINPEFINSQNNLANAYYQIGLYNDAINIYKNILQKEPNHKEVNSNIAISYYYINDFANAEKYFEITKKIYSDDMIFQKNYAHYLLFKQEYKEAWGRYWDSRLKVDEYYISNEWKVKIRPHIYSGDSLNKEDEILIIKEQGVGDEILYSTMYPDLLKSFPNCKIETEKRLISLFKRSYSAEKNIVPFLSISDFSEKITNYDKIICSGSLGKFFRTNLNDFPKYNRLVPEEKELEKIKNILKLNNNKKKVGISWKSKRKFYGDGKSFELCNLFNILKNTEIDFINLQYGDVSKDIKELKNKHNLILTEIKDIDLMNDFEKISALLCSLDLFVTVSNSTAHLAGALNVPTILIKPKSYALFHYWSQPTNTTPWYASIEMIEQGNDNDDFINKLNTKIIKYLER